MTVLIINIVYNSPTNLSLELTFTARIYYRTESAGIDPELSYAE